MIETEKLQKLVVASSQDLRDWLEKHHQQSPSVWLVTYKKTVPDKYVSVSEVLDELLCFGWIDGIRRKLNEEQTMQLISPRKAEHWTESYKKRVAKLIEEEKMNSSGLEAIERSKKLGLWNLMEDVDQLILPEDLRKALEEKPGAKEFFDGINPSSKRFVLRWVKIAKTEKTRNSRISHLAELAAKGEKLKGS